MELNELEYVKGELWANVWHKTKIARIEIKSGNLLGWIDLTNLAQGEVRDNDEHVLNGIAYDSANDRIFVTGKDWRKVYEIKLKER
jgi:glutamine cyclotransferase